jgi:hypothetical protein
MTTRCAAVGRLAIIVLSACSSNPGPVPVLGESLDG